MLVLNHFRELAEHGGLSDACHVLQTNFGCAGFNQLVGDVGVVLRRVNGRVGDAKSCLRGHAALNGIFDGGNDVAHVVQAAEDAGDVHTLGVLYLIHQTAHVGGHREHTQGVETTVEHMRLNTNLIERFGKGAHGFVGVFAVKQIDLLKRAAVGLHAGEATHLYNNRGNALQLVFARLELARRLKHVAINKAKLDFSFRHKMNMYVVKV